MVDPADPPTNLAANEPAAQPLLPFDKLAVPTRPRTVLEIAAVLEGHLPAPVAVELHRASREPIRLVRHGSGRQPTRYRLRLHEALATAPEEFFIDLSAWIQHGRRARRASERLDAFLAEAIPKVRRQTRADSRGNHHDLATIRAGLDPELLPQSAKVEPALTWSPRRRSRARRSLQLGCYDEDIHRIRIHPVLDGPATPAWFLEVLLHHELLHAILPAERRADGVRLHHGPVFRAWEARHPRRDVATEWEHAHILDLLAAARRGIPLQPGGCDRAKRT